MHRLATGVVEVIVRGAVPVATVKAAVAAVRVVLKDPAPVTASPVLLTVATVDPLYLTVRGVPLAGLMVVTPAASDVNAPLFGVVLPIPAGDAQVAPSRVEAFAAVIVFVIRFQSFVSSVEVAAQREVRVAPPPTPREVSWV